MKKLGLMFLALLLILPVLAGCSEKSNEDTALADIKSKGELVMGLDDAFPPMGFRDESNELVGFDIDVAMEVARRMDVDLKLQPIDWSQKESELASGQIDMIWNGYTITAERAEKVNFTDAYMKNRQVIVVKTDSDIQALDDLAGKKLVLQAESSAVQALDAASDLKASLAEVIELKDNVMAFLDLESGATDALLIDEIVADYYITINSAAFRVLDESLAEEEYGIGFRKDEASLRNEVQRILKEMADDGKLAEISNEWFGHDLTTIR